MHIDAVTVALVLAILLLGLVMVTSASISIASKETGDAFSISSASSCFVAGLHRARRWCSAFRTRLLEKMSMPLLIAAVVLLFLVLVPGLGHMVNGSRRWIRLLGFNFQVSELARVLVLIYLASYAVRREEELRGPRWASSSRSGCSCSSALLLLAEPDFGAATVLFATGFGLLFIAGARLRYVIVMPRRPAWAP